MIKLYNPAKDNYFEVFENDMPQKMSWIDARKSCQNNNENWRLPTVEELRLMYDFCQSNKNLILQKEDYWSGDLLLKYVSDEMIKTIGLAFTFDMEFGISTPWGASVSEIKLVRLVRNISA